MHYQFLCTGSTFVHWFNFCALSQLFCTCNLYLRIDSTFVHLLCTDSTFVHFQFIFMHWLDSCAPQLIFVHWFDFCAPQFIFVHWVKFCTLVIYICGLGQLLCTDNNFAYWRIYFCTANCFLCTAKFICALHVCATVS